MGDLNDRELGVLCTWCNDQIPFSPDELRAACLRDYVMNPRAEARDCDPRQSECIEGHRTAFFDPDMGCPGTVGPADSCLSVTVGEVEQCVREIAKRDRELSAMVTCDFAGTERLSQLFNEQYRELPPTCDMLAHECGATFSEALKTRIYSAFFR